MQQYAQYLEFIKNHWLLVLAFFLILGVIIFEEKRKSVGGGNDILPQKAIDLMNHNDALVVDLRDHEIFKNGHILGSVNIVAKDVQDIIKKIEIYKGRTIILLGKDDQSIASLQTKLQKEGFAEIYILKGSIAAWKSASLPTTKK